MKTETFQVHSTTHRALPRDQWWPWLSPDVELYAVELDACNVADLPAATFRHGVLAELCDDSIAHGFPVYRYTAPLRNLRAFLTDQYADGSGDDIGDRMGLPRVGVTS